MLEVNYKCYLEEAASIQVGAFFTGPQREEGGTFQTSEHLNSPPADSITLPCPPIRDSRLSVSITIIEISGKFKYGLFSGTLA